MSDLISREKLKDDIAVLLERNNKLIDEWLANRIDDVIDEQPTVDADEFEWCHDCKEYDQNAHCCHRWTKVIRNTVDELLAQGYERVKHGYWIYEGSVYVAKCSVCGNYLDMCGVGRGEANFCPICGAIIHEVSE